MSIPVYIHKTLSGTVVADMGVYKAHVKRVLTRRWGLFIFRLKR